MPVKVNETELSKQNNNAFGYERFDYLYPEVFLPMEERIRLTLGKSVSF